MPLLASELLDDGTLQAAPFLREDLVQVGPLLRALTGLDFDAVRQVAIYAPERLSSAGATASVEPTLNLTGYPLSSGLAYTAFTYHKEDGGAVPLSIVTENAHQTTQRHPGGIVRLGGSQAEFFPADPLGRNWESGDTRAWFSNTQEQFSYRYVPMPARVTALTQSLIAPEECRDWFQAVIESLVLEKAMTAFPQQAQAIRDRITLARQTAQGARQEFLRNLVKRLPRAVAHGERSSDVTPHTQAWVVNA